LAACWNTGYSPAILPDRSSRSRKGLFRVFHRLVTMILPSAAS
jgi:hypothetical protein